MPPYFRGGLCKGSQVRRRSCCIRVRPKSSMMREMTAEDLLCTQGPLHSAVRSPKQEGNPKKGEICIRRAGPLCRTEETNMRLESNYRLQEKLIKNNKKQKRQLLSRVHLFATPRTVARLAPLSMGCCRQEDWSGLSLSLPGDLPDPGIKPASPMPLALAGGFFNR